LKAKLWYYQSKLELLVLSVKARAFGIISQSSCFWYCQSKLELLVLSVKAHAFGIISESSSFLEKVAIAALFSNPFLRIRTKYYSPSFKFKTKKL
jgi:hypothetical protein